MNKYFKLDNYTLKIDTRLLFSINFFSLNQSTCLLGESGSGKSLFLRDLESRKPYQGEGKVSFLRTYQEVINWKDAISFSMLDLDYQQFCLSFFQNEKRVNQKVSLLLKLKEKPDYLFCEDFSFSSLELKLLLDFCQEQHIIFFYVTNDIECVSFFPYLLVLKNHTIAIEGKTTSVLQEEKIMKLLGYSLPFMVELSISLKYYGLMQDVCYTKEELEAALWHSH